MARGLSYKQGRGNYHVKGFKNASNSGYLKSGPSYFPSHAPTWYSYTLDFAIGGHYHNMGMVKTARTAEKKLTGLRVAGAQEGWSNSKVLTDIQALVDMARNSELAFLAKYGLGNPGDDWSELIKAFNSLFSSESALKMQIALINRSISNHPRGKDVKYHYFATIFASNIQTAAREVVSKYISANMPLAQFNVMLDEIIEIALNKSFEQKVYKDPDGTLHTTDLTKEEKEAYAVDQAFLEFKKTISKFLNNPWFKQSIANTLGVDMNFLRETRDVQKYKLKHPNSKKAQPKVKDAFRNGQVKGTIAEAFEAVLGEAVTDILNGSISSGDMSLNWQSVWSGGRGVKADVILHNLQFGKTITNIDNLMSQTGEDDSKRANALQKYEDWFNKMQDARGEIVFISDKNYQIGTNFKGFTAQGKVTLKNLQALFAQIEGKVGLGFNVQGMIDFLANCGNDMILGNRSAEMMDAIATQIGHFLFDDLTIEGSHSINRIHLLNLSGVYMPLSVYLEAILHAIQEPIVGGTMREYVSVNFTEAPGAEAAASPWDSKDDWEHFRNAKLAHSYVNVHFMKNFATFITSKVKF